MTQLIVPVAEGLFPGTSIARSGEAEWRKGEAGYHFIAAIQTFQVHHALTTLGILLQMSGYSPMSTRTFVLLHFVPLTTASAITLAGDNDKLAYIPKEIFANTAIVCKSTVIAASVAQMFLGSYVRPMACISVLAFDYGVENNKLPECISSSLKKFNLHETYCRTHTFSAIIAGVANSNYLYTLIGTTSLCAWLIRLYRNNILASPQDQSRIQAPLTHELLNEIMSENPPKMELNPDYTREAPTLPSDPQIDFCLLGDLFSKIPWSEGNFRCLCTKIKNTERFINATEHTQLRELLKTPEKNKELIIQHIQKGFKKHLKDIRLGNVLTKEPLERETIKMHLKYALASLCQGDPLDATSIDIEKADLSSNGPVDTMLRLAIEPVGYCDSQILRVIEDIQNDVALDLRTKVLSDLQTMRQGLFNQLLLDRVPKESNLPFVPKLYDWIRRQISLEHVLNFLSNLLGKNCDLHNRSASGDRSATIGPSLELFAAFFLEPQMREQFQKRHTISSIVEYVSDALIGEKQSLLVQQWWCDWIDAHIDASENRGELKQDVRGGTLFFEYKLFGRDYIDDTSDQILPWAINAMLFDMGILRLAGSDAVETASETADSVQGEE